MLGKKVRLTRPHPVLTLTPSAYGCTAHVYGGYDSATQLTITGALADINELIRAAVNLLEAQ